MSSEFFILDFDFCLVFCAVADDEEAFDEDDILWLDKEDTDSDRWIWPELGDGDEKLNALSLELVLSIQKKLGK